MTTLQEPTPAGKSTGESTKKPASKPKKKGRWRKWVLIKIIVLLLLLCGAYGYIANPQRAAGLAGGLLTGITGADVQIDSAHFGFDGTIELEGVRFYLPGQINDAGKLVAAKSVHIQQQVGSLFFGSFKPTLIRIDEPVIYWTQYVHTDAFNFLALLTQGDKTQQGQLPLYLPQIQLNRGQIVFGEFDGNHYQVTGMEQFEGAVRTDPTGQEAYQYELSLLDDDHGLLAKLAGQYDPHLQTADAKMEQFRLDEHLRYWLPKQWRDWCEKHQPRGTMQQLHFGYSAQSKQYFAQLELKDAQLIPPYGPLVGTDIKMSKGSGKFRFTNAGVQITGLTGIIEGARYNIDGQIFGYAEDSPFKLTISTNDLVVPDQPRYVGVLPPKISKLFHKFKPAGHLNALVQIERKNKGSKLTYQGSIFLKDVSARYYKFPYPLAHLRGELRFDDQAMQLVSITGQGNGGSVVSIRGRIWPPVIGGQVDLQITALGVPLNETLRNSFYKQTHRQAWDLFFDQAQYDRLVEAGHIQTPALLDVADQQLAKLRILREKTSEMVEQNILAKKIATQLQKRKKPVFEMGGKVNITAHVTAEPGIGVKPTIVAKVQLLDIFALFKHWPYPLKVTQGQLVIEKDLITATDIRAQSIAHPNAILTGQGTVNTQNPMPRPKITFSASGIPIDDLLLATVPREHEQWLKEIRLQGLLSSEGSIFFNEQRDQIDFNVPVRIAQGQAGPLHDRYMLKQIQGQLVLGRNAILFDQLVSISEQATLTLTGQATRQANQRWQSDLQVHAKGLSFEDHLHDLIPDRFDGKAQLQQLVQRHQPQGTFDATLAMHFAPELPTTYELALMPKKLWFVRNGQLIKFNAIESDIQVQPNTIHIKKFNAKMQDGFFSATGKMTLGKQPVIDLNLNMQSQTANPTSKALLPKIVRQMIDQLKITSQYQIKDTHVVYRPKTRDLPMIHAEGVVLLNQCAINVGVPIKNVQGQLAFDVLYSGRRRWPQTHIQLHADRLTLYDRVVSPLSLTIQGSEEQGILHIQNLTGQMYQGLLLGKGYIQLDGDGYYQFQATLSDANASGVLQANKKNQNQAQSKTANQTSAPTPTPTKQDTLPTNSNTATGSLRASLALQGYFKEPQSRQGRGQLKIDHANLYELPLALSLLQLVNLTFPSASAFEQARADFLLDGDQVLFDHLSFQSPSVRIAGGGVMDYHSSALDLKMTTSNPSAWHLGAVSDLFGKFKDELISIRITGTLNEPNAQAVSMSSTKNAWRHIFGRPIEKKKPAAGRLRREPRHVSPR